MRLISMYVTFKNHSTGSKMIVTVENQRYIINPESSLEVFCCRDKVVFEAQAESFDELADMLNELDEEAVSYSFKDRILAKLTKKFAEKLPQVALNTMIKYEASFRNSDNSTINLYDGVYSVCDGRIAYYYLDMIPVGYVFSRAEAENAEIRVLDVNANNRKKYLKLMRNMLLFMNWNFILPDLFLFIPEYSAIKICSSHLFIKRLFVGLYNKSADERASILSDKEEQYEREEKREGCFTSLIKGLVILLIFGRICYWTMTSEPDVIISEDFSSVVCFDETFVKIDSGIPDDADDVFLEDYSAYYPLADGEYDMDNYYCYIYETPEGTRYMWVKDNCADKESAKKDYEDYDNPLVYKSVGETKE